MNPQSLDPYTNTREQWTNGMLNQQLPSAAAPEWLEQVQKLQALLRKLAFHPAMQPNLQQTYMTPANAKTKVYFMWDFVGRTLGFVYRIPPSLDDMGPAQKESWNDVQSRNFMAAQLILDTKPGMLDMMVDSSYPGQGGERPVLGEDIKEAARALSPA